MGAAHTDSDVDGINISEIFKIDSKNTLVWDGFLPDGRKNQYWLKKAIDWELHLKGIKKQGGNLAYKNAAGEIVCKMAVIDIDGQGKDKISLTPAQAGAAALKANTKLVPIKSPRGNWHNYYFFNKEIPVKEANRIIKTIAAEFKNLNIAVDKVLPTPTGSQCGINLPYCSDEQVPYDPRGKPYTKNQFINRLRFNNYPITASIIGMEEGKGSRYQAICMAAAELNNADKYSDERIKQINQTFVPPLDTSKNDEGNYNDDYWGRIVDDKIFEKYKYISDENKADWIHQFTKVEDFKLPDDAEEPELEVFEHTGDEVIRSRPWVISGWLMEKCLTVLAGQPGVGKTVILHMLAWCLATGTGFFGKPIYIRGNVLIIAAEETINEINLRLKAIQKFLGGELGKYKIFKRGLEQDLKLVKFKKEYAEKTKAYYQLKKLIKRRDIKHIILDPLINFQQGSYDENSNQHMEEYIKNTLIPLTFVNNGTITTGHHTNKLSMIRVDDDSKEIEVDPQSALTAPRGASSLVAAARFVIAIQPMLKKIWNKFKEHVKDGSNFVHYAGIIEAKSNYNLTPDEIAWVKKNTVEIDAVDEKTGERKKEYTGVFSLSTLHEITKSKLKLKAAENELYVRNHMPMIKQMMDESKEEEDQITINSIVVKLAALDDRMADGDIKEATIRTDIRRKLINGFGGAVQKQKGDAERSGLAYEDGYNYWYHVEIAGKTQNWYIRRGKDFRK